MEKEEEEEKKKEKEKKKKVSQLQKLTAISEKRYSPLLNIEITLVAGHPR